MVIALHRNPVTVHGQPLADIWWRGHEWAVTAYGIEALNGGYAIEADRLDEEIDTYPWPRHMAEKEWVDRAEFATAWMVALVLHGKGGKAIRAQLEKMGK